MIPRRDLLKRLSAVAAAAGLPLAASAAPAPDATGDGGPKPSPATDRVGELLPTRTLGRTGEQVTLLGLGGHHVGQPDTDKEAEALVDAALAGGIRFVDTAVSYQSGGSESRMGRILVPKYRDVVYLMSKTNAKDAAGVRGQLDGSRQRMGVDVIDLYQVHSIESVADVDERIDNGVVDALLEAKEAGTVRHLGFTGHRDPAAFHHMLDRLGKMGVKFEAAQMPMNVIDRGYVSYLETVLPRLVAEGYGVLAMKTLAGGNLAGKDESWGGNSPPPISVIPDRISLAEAFGYVWSLPTSCLISGMNNPDHLEQNLAAARGYSGMTPKEADAVLARVADQAGRQIEFYKMQA